MWPAPPGPALTPVNCSKLDLATTTSQSGETDVKFGCFEVIFPTYEVWGIFWTLLNIPIFWCSNRGMKAEPRLESDYLAFTFLFLFPRSLFHILFLDNTIVQYLKEDQYSNYSHSFSLPQYDFAESIRHA